MSFQIKTHNFVYQTEVRCVTEGAYWAPFYGKSINFLVDKRSSDPSETSEYLPGQEIMSYVLNPAISKTFLKCSLIISKAQRKFLR